MVFQVRITYSIPGTMLRSQLLFCRLCQDMSKSAFACWLSSSSLPSKHCPSHLVEMTRAPSLLAHQKTQKQERTEQSREVLCQTANSTFPQNNPFCNPSRSSSACSSLQFIQVDWIQGFKNPNKYWARFINHTWSCFSCLGGRKALLAELDGSKCAEEVEEAEDAVAAIPCPGSDVGVDSRESERGAVWV